MQAEAVRGLLAHRLHGESRSDAKAEWNNIVEGEHSLWTGIGEPYKHTIRAFLVYFHTQILRQATERFNFESGSVGTATSLRQDHDSCLTTLLNQPMFGSVVLKCPFHTCGLCDIHVT